MTRNFLQRTASAGMVSVDEFRAFFLGEVERAYPQIERTERLPEALRRPALTLEGAGI